MPHPTCTTGIRLPSVPWASIRLTLDASMPLRCSGSVEKSMYVLSIGSYGVCGNVGCVEQAGWEPSSAPSMLPAKVEVVCTLKYK
jgi:hypothetical protein